MRTKKQIKENSNKLDKVYHIAEILEDVSFSGNGRFEPAYKVRACKDSHGWYTRLDLIATGQQWNKELVGKALVSIRAYDGDVVVKLYSTSTKKEFEVPYFMFADMILAGNLMRKFFKGFNRHKIGLSKKYTKKAGK